jgi:hypothetical protein
MGLSLKDLSTLGQPLLVLCIVLAACAGAIAYSSRTVQHAQAELGEARSQFEEARGRVSRSGEERDVIQKYKDAYLQLMQFGMVGDEQRLSWLDALRTANAQSQLYGVDYEVGVQQPYSFASEAGANGLAVQQSIMKLRLGLLNETDLFSFFQALAAQKVGAFSVNQCNLQRTVAETTKPANQATLRAECEVAWITLPGPTAAEGGS